jgi:proline iminopeptidase
MTVSPIPDAHRNGLLDVGDGQAVYWELSGNPSGKPAVALHGGPGSGIRPDRRRYFDPSAYLLVQFDQRNCGRSTPSASDATTDLRHNTTDHLLGDIEKLRSHLGIERWLVWGVSWGTTLALAYAERHPERVSELVLVGVAMTRRSDIHWLYHGARRFLPEQWARFQAGGGRADDLVAAYDRLLNRSSDPVRSARAAADWCDWEDALLSLEPGWQPNPRYRDPAFRMTFARMCAHYFAHGAWLEDDQLLRDAGNLSGIPGVMVHGRFDLAAPAEGPWLLAQAWPGSELVLVDTGHGGGEAMSQAIRAALDSFSRR